MAHLPARAAALVLVALALYGCATSGNLRTSAETGPSIVAYASMEDATRAAVAALEERRLGAGTIENTANGRIVHGELSALAGAVYNSHGGSGKVTIAQDFPGGTKLTISAVTQSRLALERVGAMDALKGYNHNDPQYAEAILETIQQRLRGDTDAQRTAHEKARLA